MDTRPCARMLAVRTVYAGAPAAHACTKRDLSQPDSPPCQSHPPATPLGQHRILRPPISHLARRPDPPAGNRNPHRSHPQPLKHRAQTPASSTLAPDRESSPSPWANHAPDRMSSPQIYRAKHSASPAKTPISTVLPTASPFSKPTSSHPLQRLRASTPSSPIPPTFPAMQSTPCNPKSVTAILTSP